MTPYSCRRVINSLASNVYEEAEDRSAAFDIAKEIISKGRKKVQTQTEESAPRAQFFSLSSLGSNSDEDANNVAMRLKDSSINFRGNAGSVSKNMSTTTVRSRGTMT